MAEIRCQMCGKPNPADAEVCQFCQARLKPVWSSKSSESFFEAESESEPEAEVPEWLSSLRGPEESASGQPGEEAPEAGSFGGIESRETGGTDAWLADLGKAEEVSPDAVSSIFDLQAGDDFAEWLSEPAEPKSEPFDFTSEAAAEGAEGGISEEAPASSGFGTTDEPFDWLADSQASKEEEEQPKGFSFEQAPLGEGEVPDWLTRMTLGEAEIPPESQSLPDWMKDATPGAQDEFGAFFASEPAEAASSEPEAAGMGTFETSDVDWMTGIYGEASAEAMDKSAAEAKGPSESQDDFPEWLAALGVAKEQEDSSASWDLGSESPQEAVAEGQPPAGDQTPDWLSGLGVESREPLEGAELHPESPVSAFSDLEDLSAGGQDQAMPDWLAKLDTEGAPMSAGEPSPFVPDEFTEVEPEAEYLSSTPDWLSQVGIDQTEIEEEKAPLEAAQEPGIEQAELPNWLEAMRPVEVGTSEIFKDTSDARLENEGPLAGLRGALPVGVAAIRQRRSTTSALKIQVPEEQQNRATVLQQLLEDESVAKPLPTPSLAAIPMLTRIGILGAFVLAAFFALWLGDQQVPIPSQDFIPQGVQDFYNQVSGLSAGLPVLFAVDYEPGFSGELDGAAVSVLGHLASKGSLVTFVSTTYNGPALAQHLVDSVNRQDAFLQAPFTNFLNLGYIPGGTAGLSAFASTPATTVPYDLNDNMVWSAGLFDPAKGLSNFAMVVVVTHDADTARSWIEQVGPALGDIPLQMVVSAQTAPLVQPYYAGLPRQVSGLVVGLPGGVAYEVLQGYGGTASQSWDAFSIVVTLAVILILIGGVFGVGSLTLTQYKQTKAEGKV